MTNVKNELKGKGIVVGNGRLIFSRTLQLNKIYNKIGTAKILMISTYCNF